MSDEDGYNGEESPTDKDGIDSDRTRDPDSEPTTEKEPSRTENQKTSTPQDHQPETDDKSSRARSSPGQQQPAAPAHLQQTGNKSTRRAVVIGTLLAAIAGFPFLRSHWNDRDEILDSFPTGGFDAVYDYLSSNGNDGSTSGSAESTDEHSEEESGFEVDGSEEIEADNEDDGLADPAVFEVASISTNSPVGPYETLYVEVTIENIGDEQESATVELIVGVDPTIEDEQTVLLEGGESEDLLLSFRADDPADGREEFPVQVDTGDDSASRLVVVEE